MATTESLNMVQEFYVGYYGRPADPAGLEFWAEKFDQSDDLNDALSAFGTSDEFTANFGSLTNEELVNNLYQQMFGRDAETEGLAFYTGLLDSGDATLASIAKQIADGAQGDDATALANKIKVAQTYTAAVTDLGSVYQADDIADAQAILASVDVTDASVTQGKAAAWADVATNITVGGPFTLTEIEGTPGEQALMWGYTPDDERDDGASQGIPVEDLLEFLGNVTNIDLYELGLIDDDGVDPAEVISNITIGDIGVNESAKVTITTTDGEVIMGEASLGKDYMNFLSNLIFDNDGNSRLYLDTENDEPGPAIILTPSQNNGGTFEAGFTSNADDTIIAGRTELLHGAYINGGGGYDTLEVDMKGVYAQPVQLLNIEKIIVQNLPNVYGDTRPDEYTGDSNYGSDSILDLSRARDLETLVVTEGYGTGVDLGDLTVVGIRNGATVRLEGGFTEDVNLHFGEGLGNAVNLELNLGDTGEGFSLNVAHNSNTLNIDSQMGENAIETVDFGKGILSYLNITGDAALYIGSDLADSFHDDRTATIDAGENTGGVELTLNGQPDVNFTGSIGDDDFTATNSEAVIITGKNGDDRYTTDESENVSITAGSGDDTVSSVESETVSIDAGDGDNTIITSAADITVTTGSGDDRITVAGTEDGNEAVVNIDAGAGQDTVQLGDDDQLSQGLIALEDSSISGENITLAVNQDSNLVQAELTGISAVDMQANTTLTITAAQFSQLGADIFTVDKAFLGTSATLLIDVTEDVTLGDLVDLSLLSDNINLTFDIKNGATLTLSAEQLHKYVSVGGIDSTDGLNGKVVITNAGLTFDAFHSDDYQVDPGGTLTDNFDASEDVTIIRSADGFNRPEPSDSTDTWTIDTTGEAAPVSLSDADIEDGDNEDGVITTNVKTLEIKGDQDIIFEDPVDLADNFTIDFSDLTAGLTLTIADFQDITKDPDLKDQGEIIGNGTDDAPARLNIELADCSTTGSVGNDKGFKSQGVQTYVVTDIYGDNAEAFVYVCDNTKDVTTLGLQGNWDDTINFYQVNWNTGLLLEGDGSVNYPNKAGGNPNYSNIGTLNAAFFWEGAPAVVNINNQGTELTTRSLHVEGINIANAESITINIENGDAIIASINNDESFLAEKDGVENLVFNSLNSITLQGNLAIGDDGDGLASLDASAVDGTFTFEMTDDVANDLSNATLTGIDKVIFANADAELTMSADQVLAVGLDNFSTADDKDEYGTLNIADLADQELDLTSIEVGEIGTVSIADVDGVVTLNSATVLGNATEGVDSVTILAENSDTTVEMTAEQFNQIEGNGTVEAEIGTDVSTGEDFVATLVITDPAADEVIDLSDVESDVSIVVRAGDVVATKDMSITGGNATLEVTGTADLTKAAIDAINEVKLADGAELTLTAAQVAAIGTADADADDLPDAWTAGTGATLNIIDVADGFNLDLDAIQDAGINIGTLTLAEDASSVTLNAAATLGGADQLTILMKDQDTSLKLTAEQYLQINDGNIVESDSDATVSNEASVTITDLADIADVVDGVSVVDIDLSTVAVTGETKVEVADAGVEADITIAETADLGDFTVVLDSQGTVLNDLLGQTIRFSTAAQAERAIEVINVGADDNGTNVVWLFDEITGTETAGKVDTSDYDAELGRVWMLESLVNNQNVEELFTSLDENIIIRVVNADDLDEVLNPATFGFDRHIEIESYTDMGDLTFNDIDEAAVKPFDFVENLTVDLGGSVAMGDLTVSNVLAAPISNDDEFNTLTINSFLADGTGNADYLLPEGNEYGGGPGQIPYPTAANTIGDVQSGSDDFDLGYVVVNTGTARAGGNDLVAGTIYFSDDGDELLGGGSTATFTINGDGDVEVKSLDTTDADITGLTVTNNAGVLTVTGGSPAAAVADTETLTIAGSANVVFGSVIDEDAAVPEYYAGVYGPDLSTIEITNTGETDLGVIAAIDGSLADPDVLSTGFNLTVGPAAGTVTATLGTAKVDGTDTTPELVAGESWTFGKSNLTITEDVVFNAGGTLILNNVALTLDGDVDLTMLVDDESTAGLDEGLFLNGTTAIDVPAGSTLTLSAAQIDGTTVTGAGTVEILDFEELPDADLSKVMTTAGDTGSVNVDVDTTDDDDIDTLPETIALNGAKLGVAHVNITGDGEVSVTGDITPVDRNDSATGGDTSDDVTPSFTVGKDATLTLSAQQTGNATGDPTTSWKVIADGAGTVAVQDLSLNSDADLSGLTATTVTAAVDQNVIFTGDLGAAEVTVASGADLQAEGSILDGVTINGEGTVSVDTALDDIDLSKIEVYDIEFVEGAEVGTITFPTLYTITDVDPVTPGDQPLAQTVTLTSVQADGQTILGENSGADGAVVVNIDDTVDTDTDMDVDAFDLSSIKAGSMTAIIDDTVNDKVVFDAAVDFGAFDIVIKGDTVTMTGAQADGLTITEDGVATLILTDLASGVDLSNIGVTNIQGNVAGGTVDLTAIAGLTQIDVDADADADLILNAKQFGALEAGVADTAADLAELNSLTVDVTYNISGTPFNVDLAINPETYDITGSAAGLVQARIDDTVDPVTADAFTSNILNAAHSITHTDLGSIVTADSGADGVALVQDIFEYKVNPTLTTAISNFSGVIGGDGDKIDLSAFGDADSLATQVAGALTTTANEIYYYGSGAAGAAESAAIAAADLSLAATWTDADAKAYIVIADNDSTGIYEFNDTAASANEVAAGELKLIGTVDDVLVPTDLIA
ncbi:MAG: DUF4214 domain-containing protein [Desulfobacterales bacterium]|nr:DUF4214 domain-containing protein [Desulfobacterales bacterium]